MCEQRFQRKFSGSQDVFHFLSVFQRMLNVASRVKIGKIIFTEAISFSKR
ncbi:hypothetical protein PAMC26510_15870 [Caballeronia sordidicola]|uniref:Uncharacterized protein n=1 Tax=Caballeronia sordidicola TaxID=196367 RepID=A0A2C9XXJ1_CABSO|nr:hypothetical protein PAMC26510_15870 [Caballeronia sordidicola]